MEIGQLEQKLLNGINVDTDGRQTDDDDDDDRRHTHNIIRPQNFCGRIKTYI